MTVASLLKDLKWATKILRRVDTQVHQAEALARKQHMRQMPKKARPAQVFQETFAVHSVRVILNSITADIATAVNLVSQLGIVSSGRPLVFQGYDLYSKYWQG
jgi:hypothetical protein